MRAAEAAAPLADADLDPLFAPFADASRIALAVSGGADSLALLDCVDRWRHQRPHAPEVIVLTVDHRLRPGSARDAAAVVSLAHRRRLEAQVLVWRGERPTSGVEAAARAARYRLLVEAARSAGATALFVAHHQDDQAETFLMRLQRGSGVFGLAAMRPAVNAGGLTIARPFLAVPRARLVATTAKAGLEPVDDPMNSDMRFDRARVRKLVPRLAESGIDAERLAAVAERLRNAAEVVDDATDAVFADALEVDEFAVAWIDPSRLLTEPREIRLRALTRLLMAIGGADYPPRSKRLLALDDAVASAHASRRFKRTLAGTVIEGRGSRLAFYRETGRTGLPSLAVQPGFAGPWDHRFAVEIALGGLRSGLTLGALGEASRRALGARADAVPAGALAALPALRHGGRILSVPTLGFAADFDPAVTVRSLVADRLREPPLFPNLGAGSGPGSAVHSASIQAR